MSAIPVTNVTTVDEFIDWLPGVRHPESRTCPGCRGDVQKTALIRLAYVFTACSCQRVPEYHHLYEQLWHTVCLRESATP